MQKTGSPEYGFCPGISLSVGLNIAETFYSNIRPNDPSAACLRPVLPFQERQRAKPQTLRKNKITIAEIHR
jgi:hypothetical protein